MPCGLGKTLCGFSKANADKHANNLKKNGARVKVFPDKGGINTFCVKILGMKNNPRKKVKY